MYVKSLVTGVNVQTMHNAARTIRGDGYCMPMKRLVSIHNYEASKFNLASARDVVTGQLSIFQLIPDDW